MPPWNCSGCGMTNGESARTCPRCGLRNLQTTITRHLDNPAPPPSTTEVVPPVPDGLNLPIYLADVRFSTFGSWTSGALYARAEGIFLLSAQDGVAIPEKAASRKFPAGDDPVSLSKSQWIPVKAIERVLHTDKAGHKIVTKGGQVPLRLDSAGWTTLRGICGLLGIPFSA